MSTCRTCRWWGHNPSADAPYGGSNTKNCGSPKIVFAKTKALEQNGNDYSEAALARDLITISDDTEEPIAADGAAVLDGSGYWGEFRTGPEFGCIHHEPT